MQKPGKRVGCLIVLLCFVIAGIALAVRLLSSPEEEVLTPFQIAKTSFRQPVHHDRPDGPTFEQEILILKPDGAALDSPVFFILGNEGDATEKKLIKFFKAYGAPENVIFVQAEHRGYGQSVTDNPDQSLPGYLTIDQALADYHRFVTAYKSRYTGPWMGAGYSYGGGLVVNFAHSYPNDMKVILASSAVIDWPFFMPQYDRQVRKNMGERLYKRMARHVRNLNPEKPFDQTWLEREFLTNMGIGISQYAQYQFLVPVFKVLSYLPTRSFISVLRWADRHVSKEAGWTAARAFGKSGLSREEAATGKYNWYTWKYQQCKRTGTLWVSKDPNGLFPKSTEEIIDECRLMFNEDPPAATNPQWNPRGMLKNLQVPVVYTIGGKDPWTPLCQEKTEQIKSEDYFYAEEGFHCPDRDDPKLGKQVLSRMLSYTNEVLQK